MFNMKNLFRQAALALALCMASLAAHADVIPASYRVTLNTAGLTGGFLDLTFNSFGGPSATATLSNFAGAFNGVDQQMGAVGNPAAGIFTLDNDSTSFNYLSFNTDFGGELSFDIVFSGDFLTVDGNQTSIFSAALFDVNGPVGDPLGNVVFNVTPLSGNTAAAIAFASDRLARVSTNVVPEPSELVLMLTGLGLMGFMVRRRRA